MNTRLSYKTVGEDLVTAIPEFTSIYKEHLLDNNVILPHVLFGDFTRFVIDTYLRSKSDSKFKAVFNRSLNFVETLFLSKDPQLEELIHVSFLENLHQAGNEYKEIKKHLGEISLKHLEIIEHSK